jgi:hypothetical protein
VIILQGTCVLHKKFGITVPERSTNHKSTPHSYRDRERKRNREIERERERER